MKGISIICTILLILCMSSCNNNKATNNADEPRKSLEMLTNYGTITFELYNETPLHRDNFIKLVEDSAYDSLLFHRVINEFMIQAGDPKSRNATAEENLGNGDLEYLIDAEFNPDLFHKRGVLGAARDGNPERASSAIQFYIVQRGVRNDSLIDVDEKRINKWLASHYSYKDPANKALVKALKKAIDAKDSVTRLHLSDSLDRLAETYTNFEKYTIPEAHRAVYKTLGGTPHLDQNYTVFGEVIEGLNIVDSIASVQVNARNRPTDDIRILSIRILE